MSIYKDYYEEHVFDEDFVKVTRCKDCIYLGEDWWCHHLEFTPPLYTCEEFFCAGGEKANE